jgi:hypothetical protein
VGRLRTGAAITLVVVLAVGWVATTRLGHGPGRAEAAVAAHPAPTAASEPPATTPASTAASAVQSTVHAGGARSLDGVDVTYRKFLPVDVGTAYLAAIASSGHAGPARGVPACSRGGEEERPWSLPAKPRRALGRYACRIEQGRAAMWWTVASRGVLAHAVAADADLASLFAWWESHPER